MTAESLWQYLDGLTKPPRSLGRLEELAVRLGSIQGTRTPRTAPRRLILFAADHGVTAAGVSAWPAQVTSLMVRNICAGTAASTVLARTLNTETVVVNVGTLEDLDPPCASAAPPIHYRNCRVRGGSRNLACEPALTLEEFSQAWQIGEAEAQAARAAGVELAVVGEMGIGNTTPAACLAMLLADVPLESAVGRGAGADDATLARKRQVVDEAVQRVRSLLDDEPARACAAVSGLEIAAMAGFYAAAPALGLTVVLDGAIATAAALIANHLNPGSARNLIAAHQSVEPAHAGMLDHLQLAPFLDWNLRLGEGTGGLLLLPLLDAATAILTQMATLESFGIAPEAQG
jgi:nicotinate-nucleotide--dimethylbenzimidazole phosphoribosyltransferase